MSYICQGICPFHLCCQIYWPKTFRIVRVTLWLSLRQNRLYLKKLSSCGPSITAGPAASWPQNGGPWGHLFLQFRCSFCVLTRQVWYAYRAWGYCPHAEACPPAPIIRSLLSCCDPSIYFTEKPPASGTSLLSSGYGSVVSLLGPSSVLGQGTKIL